MKKIAFLLVLLLCWDNSYANKKLTINCTDFTDTITITSLKNFQPITQLTELKKGTLEIFVSPEKSVTLKIKGNTCIVNGKKFSALKLKIIIYVRAKQFVDAEIVGSGIFKLDAPLKHLTLNLKNSASCIGELVADYAKLHVTSASLLLNKSNVKFNFSIDAKASIITLREDRSAEFNIKKDYNCIVNHVVAK